MYIGNNLQVADSGNKIIDDISSGFNGSTTSFALQVGGAAPVPFPINTQQVYISVNGVIQEPDPTGSAGFKISGNNIVFSSAPANGHAFFGVILAGADYVTVGTEFPAGSVTAPSMTFTGDTNTGLYSVSSGTVGFTADGVQTFTMDSNGFNFPDGKKLNLGSSSDLELFHDGSNSYIKDTGNGGLIIRSNDLNIEQADGGGKLIRATESSDVELYFNGTNRFQTTNTGTNVTGIHVDDGATHDGDVTFTGAAANVVWDKSVDDLIFYDNAKAAFGTSSDLSIFHDGTNSFLDSNTGSLKIQSGAGAYVEATEFKIYNGAASETIAEFIADGACNLYYDNTKHFETTSAGVTVTGDLLTTGNIDLADTTGGSNNRILLGTGDDLQCYHDGSNGYLYNSGSGNLTLVGNGTNKIQIRAKTAENSITCNSDGAVELYYDNSIRLATTADGADFSGTGSIKLPVGTTAQRSGSPTAGDMRYNSTLSQFEGYTSAWGALGGGATGGGSDTVFFENGQTVTTDYTITNNMNAGSFGPITINSGVTVTVGSGEVWTVV